MTKIALMGAGGKMGVRLATNLMGGGYDVAPVEVAEAGRARLKAATGMDCMEQGQALSRADVVLLAVPDRAIGAVAHQIVPNLDPGTAVIVLDAAAPHAGEMPERADVTYFVTHPCHPPIFNDETETAAKTDYFGGIHAKQHIVCALMQGPEEHYALCEAVAREIYKPVMRSHRVTVEQLAILEPALSETVGATLALALREATDEAVRRGRAGAGRHRLHARASQHRARHRLRRVSRRQILGRGAARHRAGATPDLPRRLARTRVRARGGAEVRSGHLPSRRRLRRGRSCNDNQQGSDDMTRTQRLAAGAAVMALGTGFAGGASAATICFAFVDLESQFWVAGHQAITTTLTEAGHTVIERNANEDANRQLEQVRDCIAQGVDGIILIPQDGESATTIVTEAQDADTPIAVFNRPPSDLSKGIVVVADNATIAGSGGRFRDREGAGGKTRGRKLNAIIVVGDLGDPNAVGRKDGFYASIETHADRFNVIEVASQLGRGHGAGQPRSGRDGESGRRPSVHLLRLPVSDDPLGLRAARHVETDG